MSDEHPGACREVGHANVLALDVSVRSSRFTASAKRGYVSTLAMAMRASTVRISMPTREART